MTITVGLVRQAIGQLGDLEAVWNTRLANLSDDETLADDVLNDMARAGVPWAATVDALLPIFVLVLENNQSAEPGSLTRIASGARGNTGAGGGQIP